MIVGRGDPHPRIDHGHALLVHEKRVEVELSDLRKIFDQSTHAKDRINQCVHIARRRSLVSQ